MTRYIPNEARTVLINTREGFSQLEDYLGIMWASRYPEHINNPPKPQGKWPFIRACDRKPEAVVEVSRLPAKLRMAP